LQETDRHLLMLAYVSCLIPASVLIGMAKEVTAALPLAATCWPLPSLHLAASDLMCLRLCCIVVCRRAD
jgi:hypothetical protein